jgi:uncharacterized membrane protein HdeD (DUF308 family)
MEVMNRESPRWGLVLLQGIISIIFGLMLIIAMEATLVVAIVFLGAYWLVMGVISIIGIFAGYSRAHWGWSLFSGILGIIAGVIVLTYPFMSAVLIPTVYVMILGALGIVIGIISIVQGARGAGAGVIVLGVLSIILGILIFIAPLMATYVIILIWAILLVLGGVWGIIAAFQIRTAAKQEKSTA